VDRSVCVGGYKDAGEENEEEDDVGCREEGPVEQAQHRPLPSSGCHVVDVDGGVHESGDTGDLGSQPLEPRRGIVMALELGEAVRVGGHARQWLVVMHGAAESSRH